MNPSNGHTEPKSHFQMPFVLEHWQQYPCSSSADTEPEPNLSFWLISILLCVYMMSRSRHPPIKALQDPQCI
jgi:hypothetical protein